MFFGRTYIVAFSDVSVAAVQDLFYLKAASDKPIVPLKVVVTTDSDEVNQQLKMQMKRLPATVTVGSGGSSVTPKKTRPGDAAASFTARTNDTTQASTNAGGGAEILCPEGWPSQGGLEWQPGAAHELVQFISSEACVFELTVPPGSSIKMSGYAYVGELG